MSPLELAWQVLIVFIFHSQPHEVASVASLAISLWVVVAAAYIALMERDPYPKFFGVPAKQAHWDYKPFPRKLIAAPLIAGGLLVLIAWPALGAAPAQKTDPLTTVDNLLSTALTKIENYQAQYALQRGKYFQALWSHSTPPADGSLAAPDLLTTKPTDQLENWSTLWSELELAGSRSPMRARIDVYDGPGGKGFIVTVEVIVDGQAMTRSINVGPERYRDVSWHKVEPGQ